MALQFSLSSVWGYSTRLLGMQLSSQAACAGMSGNNSRHRLAQSITVRKRSSKDSAWCLFSHSKDGNPVGRALPKGHRDLSALLHSCLGLQSPLAMCQRIYSWHLRNIPSSQKTWHNQTTTVHTNCIFVFPFQHVLLPITKALLGHTLNRQN